MFQNSIILRFVKSFPNVGFCNVRKVILICRWCDCFIYLLKIEYYSCSMKHIKEKYGEIISFYIHPIIRYAYFCIVVCEQQILATFNYKISSLFSYNKKDMNLMRTLRWELTLHSTSVQFISFSQNSLKFIVYLVMLFP